MFRQLSSSEQETVRATAARSPLLRQAAADAAMAPRLHEIMSQYARLVRVWTGDVVCRTGDYGSELYVVMEGSLREVVRDPSGVVSIPDPEVRLSAGPKRRFRDFHKRPEDDILIVDAHVRRTIADVEEVLERCETARYVADSPDDPGDRPEHPAGALDSGSVVGAFAVLTRSAFHRTVFAETSARLLAVHWRGMRDLMALFEPVRRAVSARCRADIVDLVRSGAFAIPVFSKLPENVLLPFMETADFRFVRGASSGFTAVRQGEPIKEVLVVTSGIGRLRHESAGQSRSVGFARRGDVCGLAALAAGGGEGEISATTLDFIGDTSLLALPAATLMDDCLPFLSEDDIVRSDPAARVEMGETGPLGLAELHSRSQEAPLLDFLVDNAFVRGRHAMVIDQMHCVGCDACVQACADTHGGMPRFVRTGPSAGGYAIANACMHCEEAPCLVNCPTDAIFRKFSGEVVISEVLCVGCGTCAVACPYANIRLVEMGDDAEQKEQASPVAMKCDLCIDQKAGPACVRACPHDAVGRLDLTGHELVPQLVARTPLRAVRSQRR